MLGRVIDWRQPAGVLDDCLPCDPIAGSEAIELGRRPLFLESTAERLGDEVLETFMLHLQERVFGNVS